MVIPARRFSTKLDDEVGVGTVFTGLAVGVVFTGLGVGAVSTGLGVGILLQLAVIATSKNKTKIFIFFLYFLFI